MPNALREFAYLREAQEGCCQLIQLTANIFNVTNTFLVLPPPGHIATPKADPAKEYIPALTADDGGNQNACGTPVLFCAF